MFRDDTSRTVNRLPLTRGGPLDALRFLAAFCMVIYHYAVEAPAPLVSLHPVFDRGYLATDFFLIVSGYVMGRIYGDRVMDGRVGAGAFFLRRAGRVVPAHLMMSAVFVAFVLATTAVGIHPLHPEWLRWSQLPGQVALVQSLGPFGGHGWNAPAWTLSALLVCYLAVPMLWRVLRHVANPVPVLAIGVVGVVGANALTLQLTGYPIWQMPMEYGAVRALPLFLLGAALAAASARLAITPLIARSLFVTAFVLLVGVQAAGAYDLLSLALIALMVLAAGAIPVAKPSKLLERAALVSFALFITNEFTRIIYFGVDHVLASRLHLGAQAQWLVWGGGLLAAVLLAIAFHYLVDWPSQAWIKPRLAGAPAMVKGWLLGLAPRPDPDFDPFKATGERAPRVREIVLQIGPTPGAVHRRGLEGPSGLAWG